MRDTKTHLLASFGSALWAGGTITLPNLLLAYYSRIGLNEAEVMLLIHLFRLKRLEGEYFPAPERLSQFMAVDASKVRELMASLMEKKILKVVHEDQPSGQRALKLSLHEFMVRLAEVWLEDQADSLPLPEQIGEGWSEIYDAFEKEFGRPLSPLETSQITEWTGKHPTELIMEALRLAVLRGVYNFRYMDSILHDWEKNRVRTLREAQEYEANFRERKSRKRREKMTEVRQDKPKEDKYKDLYLS